MTLVKTSMKFVSRWGASALQLNVMENVMLSGSLSEESRVLSAGLIPASVQPSMVRYLNEYMSVRNVSVYMPLGANVLVVGGVLMSMRFMFMTVATARNR